MSDKETKETPESQRAQEKKYEQEVEDSAEWGAEEKRLRAIRAKRRTANQCIMCGKPLGFFDKWAKREKHEACTQWKE
jgi:hypothetical protein